MDYIDNKGEKIGSLDVAISNEKTVTINRLGDVTTVTVQDTSRLAFNRPLKNGPSESGIAKHLVAGFIS